MRARSNLSVLGKTLAYTTTVHPVRSTQPTLQRHWLRPRTLGWSGWRVTTSHAAPTLLAASSDTPLVRSAGRAERSDSWLVRLVNDSVRYRTKRWRNSNASLVHPTRSVDGGKLVPQRVVLCVAGGKMFSRTDSSTCPATSSTRRASQAHT